jgi:hypothetical protein
MRFSNLYGVPSVVYSDNAKSFLAGGMLLEQSLGSSEFAEHFDKDLIRHVKIPLYSAWVGATWERLIRTIKNCLYKVVGRSKLSYFDLLTTLSDIQNAINSRPLTYRTSDNELDIITPNHFIKANVNPALVISKDDSSLVWEEDVDRDSLVKSLELREQLFSKFRELWYDQYLLSLREQKKQLYDTDWQNVIKAGDIVLVKMPNKPRPFWLLGRVLQLVMGFDNKVRSVKLKRADGVECHHSLCHLYPLELNVNSPAAGSNPSHCKVGAAPQVGVGGRGDVGALQPSADPLTHSETLSNEGRPRRRAALEFRKGLKNLISQDLV